MKISFKQSVTINEAEVYRILQMVIVAAGGKTGVRELLDGKRKVYVTAPPHVVSDQEIAFKNSNNTRWTIVPDPRAPENQGTVLRDDILFKQMSGNGWRILYYLAKKGGTPATVKEIHKNTDVPSEVAVRSCIQYVRENFAEGIFTSVKRKGYSTTTVIAEKVVTETFPDE